MLHSLRHPLAPAAAVTHEPPIRSSRAPDAAGEHPQPSSLSAAGLREQLRGGDLDVEVVAQTASTHADLVARARAGAPRRPLLRAAARQTAGRGRLGRAWLDAEGGSLLFSIALPWRREPGRSAAVGLACALAVAQCLRAHAVAADVKWPNDILLDGRKLAGLLAELAEDGDGARTLVVGLGLNLWLDEAQRRAIGQPVAELAERLGRESVRTDRELWLARLATAMIGAAAEFDARGFGGMREAFNAHCAYLGQPVVLHADGRPMHTGIARGVDDDGRLLLECEGKVLALVGGELSLRARRSSRDDEGETP
jgi:BirA family biotin operon repressor/biotin-[acetyl-CoA-carboxylase] ligase